MSRIRLGDKVRFVNENMEGVVTRLEGKTAGVTIEDDFEIPVLLHEIVKINNDEQTGNERGSIAQHPAAKVHTGISIAFDRFHDTLLELKLHHSEDALISFAYYEKYQQEFELKAYDHLRSGETVSLGRFSLEQFNTWPEFAFQVMLIHSTTGTFARQLVKTMRFSAKEFHAGYKQCHFLGKQAYTFRLDESVQQADLQKLREKDFTEKQDPLTLKPLTQQPGEVVDLHIEQLTANHQGMQAQEIIDLQLDAFRKSLEMAYVHKMKKIIFIHGVGNHFLRNRIRRELQKRKEIVRAFQDADTLKFGGGATEVMLS